MWVKLKGTWIGKEEYEDTIIKWKIAAQSFIKFWVKPKKVIIIDTISKGQSWTYWWVVIKDIRFVEWSRRTIGRETNHIIVIPFKDHRTSFLTPTFITTKITTPKIKLSFSKKQRLFEMENCINLINK